MYLDLARERKAVEVWGDGETNRNWTVSKGLERGLEELKIGGRIETIQTTALLRSNRIPRRILKTWDDLQSLRHQWKAIS